MHLLPDDHRRVMLLHMKEGQTLETSVGGMLDGTEV